MTGCFAMSECILCAVLKVTWQYNYSYSNKVQIAKPCENVAQNMGKPSPTKNED